MVKLLGGLRRGVCADRSPPRSPRSRAVADADAGSSRSALELGSALGPCFACRWSRDSMIERCCSRTEILRWSCSRIVGSCVENPGERHAMPTSWIVARLPLAVRGVAAALGPEETLGAFERLSFAGRWRDGGPGEVGSFLTMILGSSVRFLLRAHVRGLLQPHTIYAVGVVGETDKELRLTNPESAMSRPKEL